MNMALSVSRACRLHLLYIIVFTAVRLSFLCIVCYGRNPLLCPQVIIRMVQSYTLTIKQIASNWIIPLMTRFPTVIVPHSSRCSSGSVSSHSGKANLACLLLDYNDQSLPMMQDEWIVCPTCTIVVAYSSTTAKQLPAKSCNGDQYLQCRWQQENQRQHIPERHDSQPSFVRRWRWARLVLRFMEYACY
jgi:hypothetical protein